MPVEQLAEYLTSKVGRDPSAARLQARLAALGDLPPAEKRRRLPPLYVQVERYLADLGPRGVESEALRRDLRERFPALVEQRAFQTVLAPAARQEVMLSERLLEKVIAGACRELGPDGDPAFPDALLWLRTSHGHRRSLPLGLGDPGRLARIRYGGGVPRRTDSQNLAQGPEERRRLAELVTISEETQRRLGARLGTTWVHNTYEAAFAQLLEAYRHLDALSVCVQLLPDALLDQEKIALLSQRQACSVLLEKIDALEQARQDAESAERAKATLLACLTDELHAPVHAMIDLGRSLRAGEDSEGQRARLDALLAAGEDLLRRVEDLAEASGGPPGRRESAAEPAPLSPTGPASADPRRPARAPSVLVVDDHPVNCQVARVQLERLGYASAEVDGGRRALDALDGRRFDVVLLDVHMPALDGFETCRRIRADPGRYGRPKILMMSPRLSESDRRRCRELGADGAVAKPVSLHDLKVALRRLADATQDVAALDVDRPRLESRRTMLSEERWRQVLESFVDNGGKVLAKMHRAASTPDAATLRRLAHEMRTTAVSMGAARIAQICADVEASCEAGGLDEVGRRLELLEDTWAAFRASTRVPPPT